ncbi:MAG: hypothetical protein ABJE95_30680 [Byssovorax sp.]
MRARLAEFGKNVLRDTLAAFGAVEPIVADPAADSAATSLWYAADPARVVGSSRGDPVLLQTIAAASCMVEVCGDAVDESALHAAAARRYRWQTVIEQRSGRPEPLPLLWLLLGERPETLLKSFGFALVTDGPQKHYKTAASGWRIRLAVLSDLPRVRDTLLLRLLGPASARRQAARELVVLPPDAWEAQIALPWLARLVFEVPTQASSLPPEERDFILETREWFEQLQRQLREEGVAQGLSRGREEGFARGRLQAISRLAEKRLRRPLTEAERRALAERVDRLGDDRVDEVLLAFSPATLEAWLSDPAAV